MPVTRFPLFVLTLFICALILSATLTYPFNNDNALYAYMADLALHGHLPYTGSWDQNFPGIIAVHAAQIMLSGRSQLAFHIFDIVLQLIGSTLLYKIGARLYDARAGALAAVLAALYYVQQGLWMAGERDTYVSILLLAAFYLWLRDGDKHAFAIGLLAGLAIVFRPTYALFVPVFCVAQAFGKSNGRRRGLMAMTLGAAVPLVSLVLFYWACGGLQDFWEASILFNLKVYGGSGASFDFWQPIRFYAISLIAITAGVIFLWRKERVALFVWAGLLVASVLSLLLLYRHSVYHYHPAMTLFLLLSAVGWVRFTEWTRWTKWTEWGLIVTVVLFYGFQTFRGNTIKDVLAGIAGGEIRSLAESYACYEPSPEFGYLVQVECGEYLSTHTRPGDTIQMFGPYSFPQYYARLTSASRFQTLHALAMRGSDSLTPFQRRWRAEYLSDMRRMRPKYFIVCDAPKAFRQYYGGRLGHEILREDYRELGMWLDSNYYAETKIGAFTLYRRTSHE